MTTPLPIACTLTADELPARLDEIRDLSRHALRSKTATGTHARLTFDPAPGVRDRLAEIVAAESKCCAFLTMQLADEPDATTLTIDAPEDAGPVLRSCCARSSWWRHERRARPARRLRRAARRRHLHVRPLGAPSRPTSPGVTQLVLNRRQEQ